MAQRRSYSGTAPATTLTSAIDNLAATVTIPVASVTGYPAGGVAGPFYIVIDRGNATEEKILVESISGSNFMAVAAVGRGADGTTRSSHLAGAVVEHVITATDLDEANDHIADTTNDDHTQYLNAARHNADVHAFGAELGTPTAPPDVTLTASAAGSGAVPARSDHSHMLPAAIARGMPTGGYAEKTAAQALTTSVADVSSLTITVTTAASRRYRLSTFVPVNTGVGPVAGRLYLDEGGTELATAWVHNSDTTSGFSDQVAFSRILTPSAGAHTYRVRGIETIGDITVAPSATNPAYILIEDIGV